MTDTPERAFQEAESWLASARHGLLEDDEANANVCCAQAIHAIIRANDAISMKFLSHKATRHDDAAIIFAKLVREKKLPEGAQRFLDLIADAIRDKSGADYGKSSFSRTDAQEYISRTEQFMAMVKDTLKL